MEVPVKNQSGETVQTIELDDAVFNVPMNHPLVHQALVIYQLNKRQGTHDTKTRAQVSGGGRKPWVQKHTGRARQGSIRSPQWRHGGVVFGPHPRDYRRALPRRMRHLALKCVLSDKARQHRLVCLDSMDGVDGKTKSMVDLLSNLGVSSSALLITLESNQKVVRAAHNLQKIWTLPVTQLNAQELLRRETVIITVDAARWAEQFLAAAAMGRGAIKARLALANAAVESPEPDGAVAVADAVEAAPAPESDQVSEEEAGA
jgi:large subunit ribosomal protein L4